MGGQPMTALNLVMFPAKHLDMGLLKEILRGGHDKAAEAGACLVGGHTVEDEEPKYGLCVNGTVHPDRVITNAGSKPGDALILTKPLGTGVLFNAVRSGRFNIKELERDVLPTVANLNAAAMATALAFHLHACTDVTGFGIAGHLFEVASGSKATVRLDYSSLPIYPGALEMYRKGEGTGSNLPNRAMVADTMTMRASLSPPEEQILFDPQTSGGLLLSVPAEEADELTRALEAAGVAVAARIAEVVEGPPALEII
jgi:selenide,water dikinase